MPEHLADRLLKVADVLHWLGKYEECNAIILLSRFLRARSLRNREDLERFIEAEEAR